jgi:hypothetical protein
MIMKNAVVWDVTPCGCCRKRHIASIFRVTRIGELGMLAVASNRCTLQRSLLVTANIPSLLILVMLMIEGIRSSEMLVLIRATWHNIPWRHNYFRVLYYYSTKRTIKNTTPSIISELILPCILVVNEVPENGSWCYEYGQHSAVLTVLSERKKILWRFTILH